MNDGTGGVELFASIFRRRFIYNRLSLEIAAYLRQWPPQELDRAATARTSLHGDIAGYVTRRMGSDDLASLAKQGLPFLQAIGPLDERELLERVCEEAPRHAVILRRHPDWFREQIQAAWQTFWSYAEDAPPP
ncbi:MAG: hypothetical protein Q8R28_01825 [Dehalococcoidia bacterium]|nr:hypothetical protein [Dehalococcoidia bacterium]